MQISESSQEAFFVAAVVFGCRFVCILLLTPKVEIAASKRCHFTLSTCQLAAKKKREMQYKSTNYILQIGKLKPIY